MVRAERGAGAPLPTADLHQLLAGTQTVGIRADRLPRGQRAAARGQQCAAVVGAAPAGGARRLGRRRGLRRPPAARRIRRVDDRAQRRALRPVLSGLHPDVAPILGRRLDQAHQPRSGHRQAREPNAGDAACRMRARRPRSQGEQARSGTAWSGRRGFRDSVDRMDGRTRVAVLPGADAARRRNVGQEHGGHAAGGVGDSPLVAARSRDRAGPAAARAVLRCGAEPRRRGPVDGHRGHAGGVRLFPDRADPDRVARRLVLRRQAGVARGSGRRLSALGRPRRGPARMGGSGRRGGAGRDAVVLPGPHRSGAAGRRGVLRGDAVSDARLRGPHLHALFVRGGPVSISGGYRGDGRRHRRRGLRGRPVARGVAHGRNGRRRGRAGAARRADVAAGGHLQR